MDAYIKAKELIKTNAPISELYKIPGLTFHEAMRIVNAFTIVGGVYDSSKSTNTITSKRP